MVDHLEQALPQKYLYLVLDTANGAVEVYLRDLGDDLYTLKGLWK